MKCLLAIASLAIAAPAAAEPLRLRGDALATVQSPTGLVALEADGEVEEGIHAEALLWMGASDDETTADALVAAVEGRDASGRLSARLGRFVVHTGALRPVHVDGASTRIRLPRRFVVEGFGGVPVVPKLGATAWDWVAGARGSRMVGEWGAVGLAYLQRREAGRLAASEVGVDGGAALGRRADLGARVALDAIHGGVSDAQVTASARRGAWRGEVYAGERSAARLLPATSLFSVLGDVPSRRGGGAVRWRAAPRLDVRASGGLRDVGDDVSADVTLRADLRLDDRGAGLLALELRRDAGWSGVRGIARVPVAAELTVSAEVELVRPDDDAMSDVDTGSVWPWALVAARWTRGPWEVAGAVEASSSATERYRFDALARVGRTWEVP